MNLATDLSITSRPKPAVVLLAYRCAADDVGESRSNFEWACRLSDHCELTVLHARRKGERSLSHELRGARVIHWNDVGLPHGTRALERIDSMAKPGHFVFFARARHWLKTTLRRGERIDVIHQLGPLAPRFSCAALGLGVPYMIGPVAGSLPTPAGFRDETSEPWYQRARAVDALRYRFDPLLRSSYRNAAVVIGAGAYVRDVLRDLPMRRFTAIAETAAPPVSSRSSPTRRAPGAARLLFVGRLIRTKGARDAIRALAHLADRPAIELDIVGEGPDRAACEREAQQIGVAGRVRFHGRVPRAEVDAFYAAADIFVFPSFREPSGNVVYEALAHGLPSIVADRGGPAEVIDDTCGRRVEPTDPATYAGGLAHAIRELADDPGLRQRLSDECRVRAATCESFDARIRRVVELYHEVLSKVTVQAEAS